MAYCAVADVAALLQQQNGYTTTSVPTANQVQGFIDLITAEIDTTLKQAGYTVPIATAAAPYNAATALSVLKLANMLGAGALAQQATGGPLELADVRGGARSSSYWHQYRDVMDRILKGELELFDAQHSLEIVQKYLALSSGNLEQNPPTLPAPDLSIKVPGMTKDQVW
ncbi:MAG: hypothetical protein M3O91_07500 [Chloroflexota bacterium]|nr:hypothetical protein [Chloroflexota bacterium]